MVISGIFFGVVTGFVCCFCAARAGMFPGMKKNETTVVVQQTPQELKETPQEAVVQQTPQANANPY